MSDVLKGFLRVSDATNRLARGMWAGLPRPDSVVRIKAICKKLSVGHAPWWEQAGRRLWSAAVEGELTIYVVGGPHAQSTEAGSMTPETFQAVTLPVNAVKRLKTPRGVLLDRPIQPTLRTAVGDEKLFALLTDGFLVVRASDFSIWYRSERAKGKWASQRSKSKVRNGRPTTQTEGLRNAVLVLVRDLKWRGKDGIMTLHDLLVASGRSDVPRPQYATQP
jgi:hypothetical protein